MADGTCACCGGPAAKKYCSRDCYHLGSRKSERLTVTCPCGRSFETTAKQVADGRGKFCSRACKDANATRPSGLKYNITKVNAGRFKPGHAPNETSFKPGQAAWNKGIPSGIVPPNAFQRKPVLTYGALHLLVRRTRGPAKNQSCILADSTCKGPMHWANISGRYEGVEDFAPMCQSHHWRHDKEKGYWGKSTSWPGRAQ